LYEIAAWLAIAAPALSGRHAFELGNVGWWLVGVAGAAVRLGIASESVRFGPEGVSWRTLFVNHRIGWNEITSIEVVARPMNIRIVRGLRTAVSPCLVIERGTNAAPVEVIPSLWVPMMRLGEFISAARLISPSDWSATESTGHASDHRPSGKRVGRPIRARDR
jgi:hypothetical protein